MEDYLDLVKRMELPLNRLGAILRKQRSVKLTRRRSPEIRALVDEAIDAFNTIQAHVLSACPHCNEQLARLLSIAYWLGTLDRDPGRERVTRKNLTKARQARNQGQQTARDAVIRKLVPAPRFQAKTCRQRASKLFKDLNAELKTRGLKPYATKKTLANRLGTLGL